MKPKIQLRRAGRDRTKAGNKRIQILGLLGSGGCGSGGGLSSGPGWDSGPSLDLLYSLTLSRSWTRSRKDRLSLGFWIEMCRQREGRIKSERGRRCCHPLDAGGIIEL